MIERPLPQSILREVNSPASRELFLVFVDIFHPQIESPIHVVADPKNFILDGEEYIGMGFELTLLTDSESLPTTQVRIPNVDDRIGSVLLDTQRVATMRVRVLPGSAFVLDASPRVEKDPGNSHVIWEAHDLQLRDVECDALTLTGRLMVRDYTNEPYPGMSAVQAVCPGLYR